MGITPKQLAALEDRLRRKKPTANEPESSPPRRTPHRVLLGIDPSLRGTGWGILCPNGSRFISPESGTVKCPAGWPPSMCLAAISKAIREVVRRHSPEICVVEGLFYAQNMRTALMMGQARGAALAPVAEAGLEVYELAPRRVKQAVVGYGAAGKTAVAKMIQRQLLLAEPPAPDAADALAVALAFAQSQGRWRASPLKRI